MVTELNIDLWWIFFFDVFQFQLPIVSILQK